METRINPELDLDSLAEHSAQFRKLLSEIQGVAAQINLRGWCEANAGNISINVTRMLQSIIPGEARWYLVSRSGSRYRQLARDPIPGLVLISVLGQKSIHCPSEAAPTSEWGCHKKLQEHFIAKGLDEKVVLHSHPASIILLSQMDIYSDAEILNQALAEALPEFSLYLPQGIACVPFAPPGSIELAESTINAVKCRKVLFWQGHGMVSCGENPDQALDRMEVAEKATDILLKKFCLTNYRP
ncbi:MAG: class II aldolase/adducin family protein [Candidatus Syntrophosphaera sp.]